MACHRESVHKWGLKEDLRVRLPVLLIPMWHDLPLSLGSSGVNYFSKLVIWGLERSNWFWVLKGSRMWVKLNLYSKLLNPQNTVWLSLLLYLLTSLLLYLLSGERFARGMVERPLRACNGAPLRAWYIMTWQREPSLDQGDARFYQKLHRRF